MHGSEEQTPSGETNVHGPRRSVPLRALIAAVIAVVATVGAWLLLDRGPPGPVSETGLVPDFAAIQDVREKKRIFFDFLAPMVERRNERILEQRVEVASMRDRVAAGATLDGHELERVQMLLERYGVALPAQGVDLATLDTLLRRCDVIPPSLALAQAASESGWGTSRFARDGNNYFGEWCYEEGCGMVPASRSAGMSHEVEVFDTVEGAVASYFRNLNQGGAYASLRALREQARAVDRVPTGPALAAGLTRYSERGEIYVEEVRSIISFNELDERYGLDSEPSGRN